MALLVKDIKLPLNEKESLLSKVTAKTLGIPENAVKGLAIKRISLDARKKNDICFIYTVEISLEPRDERRILKRPAHGMRGGGTGNTRGGHRQHTLG